MNIIRTGRRVFAALVGLSVAAGCTHLGPKSVVVDRFDYSTAIAESWKQQTLLNIVFFFTLADTGSSDRLPLVTIPAQ